MKKGPAWHGHRKQPRGGGHRNEEFSGSTILRRRIQNWPSGDGGVIGYGAMSALPGCQGVVAAEGLPTGPGSGFVHCWNLSTRG